MRPALDVVGADVPGDLAWFAVAGQEHLLRWATTAFIGAATVVTGWYLSSGEGRVEDQVGPVAISLVGLLVTVGGHASLTRRMRTRLWARRELLLGAASTLLPNAPANRRPEQRATAAGVHAGAGRSKDPVTIAAPAGSFFHRPECPLVRGKPGGVEASMARHVRAGKAPCGVCRP